MDRYIPKVGDKFICIINDLSIDQPLQMSEMDCLCVSRSVLWGFSQKYGETVIDIDDTVSFTKVE